MHRGREYNPFEKSREEKPLYRVQNCFTFPFVKKCVIIKTNKIITTIHLRGVVKFPTGGDEAKSLLSPRAFIGRIWCDSKADSTVWMGEDGGSLVFIFYYEHVFKYAEFSLKDKSLGDF